MKGYRYSEAAGIAAHVVRGLAGFAFLAAALVYASRLGWWTILPAAGALVVFRGCPMYWTVGLVETVLHRWKRTPRAESDSHVEGSCAGIAK